MITVVSSVPVHQSRGQYLDDPIVLTFSKEIEASYASSTYCMLYRTNETADTFYELVGCAVSVSNTDIRMVPIVNLTQDSHYCVIITGGSSGIQSIDNDNLDGNVIITFETNTIVRPVSNTPEVINSVGLFVDGTSTPGSIPNQDELESYDLFSASGETTPISMISSIPADMSVGVENINKVIFTYNDTVANQVIPVNALSIRYNNLPIDIDPFADRSITVSGVTISEDDVIFTISSLGNTENKEFIVTLAPNVVRGTSRKAYDHDTHVIRFMGKLNPLYANPEQILSRISAWRGDFKANVRPYDIYKLIHEKSIWVKDVFGVEMTAGNMAQVNRLTICLVLLEMVGQGLVLSGRVKQRAVLATTVVYDNADIEDIVKGLKDCINESTPEGAVSGTGVSVMAGIKSKGVMRRETKRYGVYR